MAHKVIRQQLVAYFSVHDHHSSAGLQRLLYQPELKGCGVIAYGSGNIVMNGCVCIQRGTAAIRLAFRDGDYIA